MKGIYVLVISVDRDIDIRVGMLGNLAFKKGLYAYVGSAQNNLEKRVGRHLSRDKRKFWHIDYLLGNEATRVLKVFYEDVEKEGECFVARKMGEASVSIEGFGSSDCVCESHLFKIGNCGYLRQFMHEIATKWI